MDHRTIPMRIGVAAAFLAFSFLVLAGLGSALPRSAEAVDAPPPAAADPAFSARISR
jgi:hypothetical protein